MKSLNSYSSLPSLATSDSRTNIEQMTNLAPKNLLNPNLLLEISKTAQLLSNQLLQLHQHVVNTSSSHLNMTPISSGYNSVCQSANSSTMKSYCKTSSTISLLNSTLDDTSSTGVIKRRLFESDMSMSSTYTSLNASNSSSSAKKVKSNHDDLIIETSLNTPDSKSRSSYKTPKRGKTPQIPKVKDSRKIARSLTNYYRYKLRRALNKSQANDF
jgi:hypothetical protein